MAQTGYTPIALYYSSTASATPTAGNLVNGELALNNNDGKLFYKDSSGVVQVIGTKGGVGTSTTTQVLYNSSGLVTGSSSFVFDGTNVGIGTASPQYKLHSNSANNSTSLFLTPNSGSAAGSYTQLGWGNSSSSATVYGGIRTVFVDPSSTSAVSMQFFTDVGSSAYAERMRIDSSGNLLVGTTSTNGKLSVVPTTSQYGIAVNAPSSSGTYYLQSFLAAGTVTGSITSNGTLTVYATTSDYRLKENIKPMVGALATVAELKPVTYDWAKNKASGQGFIAHELQAVIPDAVVGVKDAVDSEGNPVYQQIDTTVLVATLAAAIQEQQALIESLTTRLTALEAK